MSAKQRARLHIAALIEAQRESKNALNYWEAIRLCRKYGLSIPREVLAYLDTVAATLLNPEHAKKRGKGGAAKVAEQALGLYTGKGRGTAFTEHHRIEKQLAIASDMETATKCEKVGNAAERIANKHQTKTRTVLDVWRSLRKFLPLQKA